MVGNLIQMMSMGLPEAMQAFARQYGPVFKASISMHRLHVQMYTI
jgi:hypothetical protein